MLRSDVGSCHSRWTQPAAPDVRHPDPCGRAGQLRNPLPPGARLPPTRRTPGMDHPPSTDSSPRTTRRALSMGLAAVGAIAAPIALLATTAGGPALGRLHAPQARQ